MSKLKAQFVAVPLALMTYSTSSAKDDSLSLNGFSGLYNVPNAHVTEYGTGIASYSDMMFFNGEYRHNNNIVGSFGILPHVEVSGRIAWFNSHTNTFISDEPEARDLSSNIKINIPFIPQDWFSLAIGEQDVGGALSFFDAQYVVASKRIGPIRIDAGVGKSDATGRLDGAFGGVEFSPFEWISLLAEYDAQDTNTGFRLSTPESWLPKGARVDLTVLADSDNETANGKSFYGVGFKFPLGGGFTNQRPKQHPRTDVAELSRPVKSMPMHYAASKFGRAKSRKNTVTDTPRKAVHSPTSAPTNSASLATSEEIAKRLEKHGFERIDVGTQGNTLIVAFENNVYNRSEIDAIGVALNTITDAAKQFDRTTLVLRNQGFPVIAIDTNPKGYQDFLNNSAAVPLHAYYPKNMDFDSVAWQASAAHLTAMKPRLTISPVIANGIATEYGVWDYSWGLSFNLASQLWPGGVISASVTDHFESSEDYETGFFRNAKVRSGLREMTIQQGFKLSSFGFNNTHFGRIIYDYIGLQNETLLFTPSGAHQVLLKLGDFEHEDTNEQRDYQLLTYRYYIDDYDISLRFTQGKFWGGDNGFRVNALFQFGDQTIDLFYKNTDAKDVFSNETSAEFIGIAWKLPLTFRKDWSNKYFQVKGDEAWRWGFETRIGEEVNSIAFGVAGIPTQEWEIERAYLNNDKLSPEYIYQSIHRLKEASKLED